MTRVARACTLQSLQLIKIVAQGYVYFQYLQDADSLRFAHNLHPTPEGMNIEQTRAGRIIGCPSPPCTHDGKASTSTTPPPPATPSNVPSTLSTSPPSAIAMTSVLASPFQRLTHYRLTVPSTSDQPMSYAKFDELRQFVRDVRDLGLIILQ